MEGLEGLGMQEIGEVIPSFVAQRATVLKAIDTVKTRRDKKGRLWPDGDSLKILEQVLQTGEPEYSVLAKWKATKNKSSE